VAEKNGQQPCKKERKEPEQKLRTAATSKKLREGHWEKTGGDIAKKTIKTCRRAAKGISTAGLGSTLENNPRGKGLCTKDGDSGGTVSQKTQKSLKLKIGGGKVIC